MATECVHEWVDASPIKYRSICKRCGSIEGSKVFFIGDWVATPQGPHRRAFLAWWLGNDDLKLCTDEQALGCYMQTFPGRVLGFALEMLREAYP